MNIVEATKLINELINSAGYMEIYGGASNEPMNVALEIAVDSMQKQIPMKGKIFFGAWFDCPTCETDISGFEEKPYYCPNCGQAIDWGEE